jgi:hypothetical protein
VGHPAAEKVIAAMKSNRQALKRERLFKGLAARVNSCPSLLTAKAGFFRNL